MRKVLFAILCCLPWSFTHAQTATIDSLQRVLSTAKKDTNRIKTLLQLNYYYRLQANPAKAMEVANEALDLAEALHDKQDMGMIYLNKGYTAQGLQKPDEALRFGHLALQSFQAVNDKVQVGNAFSYIGLLHVQQEHFPEAHKNYQLALQTFQSINDKQQVGWTFFRLAQVYTWQKDNPEAIKFYFKAFGTFEGAKDKYGMASCLLQIGIRNQFQASFEEAINYYNRSLSIYEELGDKEGMLSAMYRLQNVLWAQKRYADGLNIGLRALQIAQSMPSRDDLLERVNWYLGTNYAGAGWLADSVGDKATAKAYFSKALPLLQEVLLARKKREDTYSIPTSLWSLGDLYLKMKEFDLAEKNFAESLALAQDLKDDFIINADNEGLAEIYYKTGNYKKAYEHYKTYMDYRDTLMINDKEMRKIAEAKGRYEAIKKEDSLRFEQQLTSEKLKRQQLLAVQQAQALQLKEASLKLSNQQKELSDLAFLRTEAELKTAQSQRQEKEKQLQLSEKEKAFQQTSLRLKAAELSLKEREIAAQRTQRNLLFAGAAVLAALAFGFYRNRQQKQRTKNLLEKQRLRTQIAADLHDEIGSTLTSISFFSEVVKQQVPEAAGNARYMLEKIGDNARTVVSTMKDIVWVINPNNDVPESLLSRMRSHAVDLCSSRNIDCEFNSEGETSEATLDLQQRKNIYLVYKEAVHNAVKYAGCNRIAVTLARNNGFFHLKIQDNGKGFDTARVDEGNGLINMKRRAEEIGADLTINTRPGKGTCVELSVNIT